MIEVKLRAETILVERWQDRIYRVISALFKKRDGLLLLASHAAQKCYQAESPKLGSQINVKGRLFETSHHTTLEHHYFTFDIEGIAVSDITLGAHLDHPFYNSDQRSGRFCAKMFLNPDFPSIEEYIRILWPDLPAESLKRVMDFAKNGVEIYHRHIEAATKLTAQTIAKERPNAPAKYIEANAPKIAQEQLRSFISAIFPTGFDHTFDLIGLVSLYKAAWTPGLMHLTQKMADLVLARHPEVAYMFSRRGRTWSPNILRIDSRVKFKPGLILANLGDIDGQIVLPEPEDMYPVDLLHFLPEYMDNNIHDVKTSVEISLACMGQDQRHRTIRRGKPVLTGNFYLPPVIAMLPNMAGIAKEYLYAWLDLAKSLPPTLSAAIAPYGAMVSYDKKGSLNAIFHEQGKRLCWCAQEEIYHLGRGLRQGIESIRGNKASLLSVLEPPCFKTGKCAEGARYCGRDIDLRKSGDYFSERKV
ncbi:MAG: FAD-dependent thymidylate synthase [Candidatus Portnoybacteria bacterium]|nr:FAD-dependent thymidylate synthase [Candidatus Portnoybacteria bacterium]MDD4982917.1 FAD-dependent thymidylate synthase [Candidatus Portnoybacteria bacterium]